MIDTEKRAADNKRLAWKLLGIVALAVGFAFALVPLYNVFCDLTGLNGKTEGLPAEVQKSMKVDESRWVTVQFVGNVNSQLDWQFTPERVEMKVHPGAINDAWFDATNKAQSAIVGNAVPSIAPSQGSPYFNKIECFCFTEQTLKPGESRRMPVKFVVDPKLPKSIDTLTLSYTFYNNRAATRKLVEQAQSATPSDS